MSQSLLKAWIAVGVRLKGELEGLVRAVKCTTVELKPQIKRLSFILLECRRAIAQTKRHYQSFIVVGQSYERHLPLITFSDADQVVGAAEVQRTEYCGTREDIQGGVGERKSVTVLDCVN